MSIISHKIRIPVAFVCGLHTSQVSLGLSPYTWFSVFPLSNKLGCFPTGKRLPTSPSYQQWGLLKCGRITGVFLGAQTLWQEQMNSLGKSCLVCVLPQRISARISDSHALHYIIVIFVLDFLILKGRVAQTFYFLSHLRRGPFPRVRNLIPYGVLSTLQGYTALSSFRQPDNRGGTICPKSK